VDAPSPGMNVFAFAAASLASIRTSPSKAAPAALSDNLFALSFSDCLILIKSSTFNEGILLIVYKR
jgi:hypothetical protein